MFFSIKVVNYGHGRGNFSTPFSPLLIGVYALPGTIAAKSKFFVRQPRLFISPTGRGRGRGQNISRSTNSTGWLPLAPLVCHSHPSVVRPPVIPPVETCHLRARHQFPTQLHFKDAVKRTRTADEHIVPHVPYPLTRNFFHCHYSETSDNGEEGAVQTL